jgi:hypothetical protein
LGVRTAHGGRESRERDDSCQQRSRHPRV